MQKILSLSRSSSGDIPSAGQEDQLGALGLVVNMIVLWNTIYMEAALNQLRLEGHQVCEADVARLSPLIHDHINMLGRYSFAMPKALWLSSHLLLVQLGMQQLRKLSRVRLGELESSGGGFL